MLITELKEDDVVVVEKLINFADANFVAYCGFNKELPDDLEEELDNLKEKIFV